MPKFQEYTKPEILKESPDQKLERARTISLRLKKAYPEANMILKYGNEFQLLVAVILSAQCTDKKVNEVTPPLFKKYKTSKDFAKADQKELERFIYQTGFYHAKAKNIIGAAQKIEKDFGGKLPTTISEMITIPGVARKTANVVLGNAHGVVEGIAVDTHVARIAQRLGLTRSDKPVVIERDLMNLVPKKEWFRFTYRVIDHGRAICTAQKRKCESCPLKDICPSSLV